MKQSLRPAIVALLAFTVITGVLYPVLVLGIAQLAFPRQANGDAALIGQPFDKPAYLWGRPSAVAYNAMTSSGTNLGPANPALHEAAAARVKALRDADPGNAAPIPVDLVTSSASGLDPHISPAAAYYQAARIARARGLAEADVRAVIADHVEGRTLGVLGEPRVNVAAVNRALDARNATTGPPR